MLLKNRPKRLLYFPCGIVFYGRKNHSLTLLITSICVFFVFGTSARDRVKLPLLVGEQFLSNWSESGIPGCILSILVTDGFYTIRYATFFFQPNLSPSFGLALNDLLRPHSLALSKFCILIVCFFCKIFHSLQGLQTRPNQKYFQ